MAAQGRMTVTAWARSRGIPSGTAWSGVRSGRITRGADRLLDPEEADRECQRNTGLRIDNRLLSTQRASAEMMVRRKLERARAESRSTSSRRCREVACM